MFVNLPTGFGKLLIYQLAPSIVAEMSRIGGKIRSAVILVISPLVSLTKDQVQCLERKGIKASFIGEGQEQANLQKVFNGETNIVYSSPEAVLGNDQWREMVSSPIYQRNVIAVAVDEAHCFSCYPFATTVACSLTITPSVILTQ